MSEAAELQTDFRERQTDEQVADFQEYLGRWLALSALVLPFVLSCDYMPDRVLRWAADAAGLPYSDTWTFPWKTYMTFSPGRVEVQSVAGVECIWSEEA